MMKAIWIEQLERQGCFCDDWSKVRFSEDTDFRKIRNVYFRGDVTIGANAEIVNVPGGIANLRIGDNVRIINTSRIECSEGARFGVGTDIDVLDETGHHIVRIYPGISSQIATLSARMPEYASKKLLPLVDEHIKSLPDIPEVGDNVEIIDCGALVDVRIYPGLKVEGAIRLCNGSIVNNSCNGKPLAYVGYGVDAENFIIEDGEVKGGSRIVNAYVGQGAVLDKGFTAHDSLFFANCNMECGEACALLAGPYSVSMHKSSLLIGVQTSFFNAGSGTNMSNHMYKLGPVNWGVMERGVKLASKAYVMQGARIGAYSLVMGDHKTHPDTSDFPFSYLFGNEAGETIVVPGAMLKSYGLRRDEDKWPARDRRQGHGLPLHDRITFPILNPYTAGKMLKGIDVLDSLFIQYNNTGEIENKRATGYSVLNNLKFSSRSLLRSRTLYATAIYSYLYLKTRDGEFPQDTGYRHSGFDWIDLGGLLMPASILEDALRCNGIKEMENVFSQAHSDYDSLERAWISVNLKGWANIDNLYSKRYSEWVSLIEKDKLDAIDALANEEKMLRLHKRPAEA